MKSISKLTLFLLAALLAITSAPFNSIVGAISDDQKKIFNSGVYFYDKDSQQCGGNVEITGSDNAEKAYNFFISKGLTPIQAAGILGNLKNEGGFEPRRVEYGFPNSRGEISKIQDPSSLDDVVPVKSNEYGQPGYGIVQWSGGRKLALAKYAEKQKQPPNTIELQLEFMWKELSESYSKVLAELKGTSNIEDATRVILFKYEIPAKKESKLAARSKDASGFLKKYGGGAVDTFGCDSTNSAGQYGWDIDGANAMVSYSQNDAKWANKPFGSTSIAEGGCGPTSVAMVLATLLGDKSITPESVAAKYGSKFYIPGVGSSHALFPQAAKDNGLKIKALGTDTDAAAKILKEGGLVIGSFGVGAFTSAGHIMVVRAVSPDGKSFYLNDPNMSPNRKKNNTDPFTVDFLRTEGHMVALWGYTK